MRCILTLQDCRHKRCTENGPVGPCRLEPFVRRGCTLSYGNGAYTFMLAMEVQYFHPICEILDPRDFKKLAELSHHAGRGYFELTAVEEAVNELATARSFDRAACPTETEQRLRAVYQAFVLIVLGMLGD